MPHLREYRVHIDAFEGPLDLLLFLIRRAEVEITDIPVAVITEQYLDFLKEGGIAAIDVDRAGEFLVMAATLMEIKSRMIMPPEPGAEGAAAQGEGDDERPALDPREELIRQLLEYKRFRDAADRLESQRANWESRYPAGRGGVDRASLAEATERLGDADLDELQIEDLVEAFSRIMESVDFDRLGQHTVTLDETPQEIHAEDLIDFLGRERGESGEPRPVTFASIFKGRTRAEMIGLFLAMLELVRQRRIAVRQAQESGAADADSIVLSLREPEEEGEGGPAAGGGEQTRGGEAEG